MSEINNKIEEIISGIVADMAEINKGMEAEYKRLQSENDELKLENELLKGKTDRLASLLHDEMSQLNIATDLADTRWRALNEIYTNGEKHNANWCKRKAQEGLGIKNG